MDSLKKTWSVAFIQGRKEEISVYSISEPNPTMDTVWIVECFHKRVHETERLGVGKTLEAALGILEKLVNGDPKSIPLDEVTIDEEVVHS